MSRLIDADALESVDFSECTDSMEIMAVIDAQPTAYDVDKVVGQLKDHAIEFEAFGQCSDYVELSNAIDIVKGGRVDE
ncbi:MAG: hypothetical protein MR945_09255 [Agathobacter sp.]|nr:hypothetical protein [Agathobacter sp.]